MGGFKKILPKLLVLYLMKLILFYNGGRLDWQAGWLVRIKLLVIIATDTVRRFPPGSELLFFWPGGFLNKTLYLYPWMVPMRP